MAFVDPTTPNLADFITFCQAQGVVAGYLDPASPYFVWALTHAEDITILVPQMPAAEYVIAVYNLGMHWLVSNAQDVSGLAITSLAWSNGAVIVTPAVALSFPVGQAISVVIGGALPLAYNGSYSAQVISSTTFAYGLEANPGIATSTGVFGLQFFASLRKQFNLLSLVAGPVESSQDQGTGQKLLVPDFFKNLTFSDLDAMKTPWGQRYLAYAQQYGPNIVDVS